MSISVPWSTREAAWCCGSQPCWETFFWTLSTYFGVWKWGVFKVLSSLNKPQNQTTLWISIKWEIGVIHEGGSGEGGVTERKSSNSVWGLASATAVFLQRNDCICNVKPICNALFLLHAPRPQSQSDEGSQIGAVTDNNGMWTDGLCTVWKCSIKPPPDWSSQPEMRLALAETYGTLPPITHTIGGEGGLHPLAS